MKKTNSSAAVARSKSKGKMALVISVIVLGVITLTLAVLYGVSLNAQNSYQTSLENIYQKNFYELVDEVNNVETKLNKVLTSANDAYKSKLLKEVSRNQAQHASIFYKWHFRDNHFCEPSGRLHGNSGEKS